MLITFSGLHTVIYSASFPFDSIVLVQDMQSCMFANGYGEILFWQQFSEADKAHPVH